MLQVLSDVTTMDCIPRNGQFYPETRLQGAFHLVKEREDIRLV